MRHDYTYWVDRDGLLIGYLNVCPERLTQGRTIEELEDRLADFQKIYEEGDEYMESELASIKRELDDIESEFDDIERELEELERENETANIETGL
jgi:uncharacterized protein YydD (DUF2326 family)